MSPALLSKHKPEFPSGYLSFQKSSFIAVTLRGSEFRISPVACSVSMNRDGLFAGVLSITIAGIVAFTERCGMS